ncbi:MAG: TolC family protein, partial [Lentisphaerae bacterium]|nr:TolC family protein [Lentisphaerota bacterium]
VTAYRAGLPLWQSSRFDLQTRELDVLEEVFQSYINLLSQRALLVIDIDNYHLIQRYLELARSRQRSGVAGPEELYRWEAQLAAARSAMLRSLANMSIAQTQLNQAMGNDADDLWSPADLEELTEANPCLAPEFSANITDDREFEALTAFLLRQALDESPELRAVDAAITAQTMVFNQYRRRRFVPEVGVSFTYDHTFDRTRPSGSLPLPLDLPQDDDDDWSVLVGASWSLFEGGGQAADVRRARAELRRLRELRRQARQAVTQRLYAALLSLAGSQPDLHLTRQAAELAGKNLEVIQEKYARGAVAIVDLLDAQTDTFVREQRAALARYQFMLDIFRTQRAIGWLPELRTPEQRAAWVQALKYNVYHHQEDAP